MEIAIVKPLENQKVLISEKNKDKNGQVQERLYIVPEENTDKFIKQRNLSMGANDFQKTCSTLLSICSGFLVAASVTSKIARIPLGILAGGAVYLGAKKFDTFADKSIEQVTMNKYNVEEVTKQV